MKRKRGHKKGTKSKKSKSGDLIESNENAETQTSEQSSEGHVECEKSEHDESTRMEVDAPSSTGSGNSPVAASVDPAAKSVARVKVKLKTSKAPEPDDVGNDKSSSLAVCVKPDEKKEELVPGLPERRPVFLNVYRKTKGIKIKTSKALDGSSSVTEKSADAVKVQDAVVLQKETKTPDEKPQASKNEPENTPISLQKEEKKSDLNSRYNKQELEDSLTVIKKIMKMDAADPFNAPVNPEALGIPDYFDIIKTPMDFGTICNNFEKSNKYMNSEDVYKDVQYIWNNCSKYNKKGDYIVDLMKRVKKNFMKYWTAAGLYTEQSAGENTDDGGKTSTKGSQSKQKSHKRHGRHHKSDCMCAVCVLKRRKRERERDTQGHSGAQEESSFVGSPSVGNSSINMGDEQDMDTDVDNKTEQEKTEIVELDSPVSEKQRVTESKQEVEEEEENVEVESENKAEANVEDKTQSIDRSMDETGDEPVTSATEKLVALASVVGPKSTQNEEEEKEKQLQKQKKRQELERNEWRMKMQEKFEVRNPQLLSLCETLFPNDNNHTSVWNGPHSLFKSRGGPNRNSALHKAVEALMK
ncbi:PREDICTED: bromodomain-containing protein 4 [Camelina sativa]|uniref:Bromodomain-containing protein 4 n=1 Tax=Camelina sativa TaxID=90675 RepID=A0ABM1R575_CAMSA|nr:PREDICTED: bromodomain-containing protein 4 [Camelina sativa]XP_019094163.1 PREDICTED: bromodomain-containing protein 4 [Camelina sativa]